MYGYVRVFKKHCIKYYSISSLEYVIKRLDIEALEQALILATYFSIVAMIVLLINRDVPIAYSSIGIDTWHVSNTLTGGNFQPSCPNGCA
jgi:hypothetical protein|tara:strand:+ start:311 stop:580 length:270 start_codon:yes stop_codon:yes gene_type:complete